MATTTFLVKLPEIKKDSYWRDHRIKVLAVGDGDEGLVVFIADGALLRADKITFLEIALGKPLKATIELPEAV
jgi:hypothetical protein